MKKLSFTKIIVTWSMAITTLYLIITNVAYYITKIPADEATSNLMMTLILGTIITYMGKSGLEFYQNKKVEISNCKNNINKEGELNGTDAV